MSRKQVNAFTGDNMVQQIDNKGASCVEQLGCLPNHLTTISAQPLVHWDQTASPPTLKMPVCMKRRIDQHDRSQADTDDQDTRAQMRDKWTSLRSYFSARWKNKP